MTQDAVLTEASVHTASFFIYAAWVFYRQEQFNVQESDYPNIGTNPKRLVVYFSRMGYVKKQAMEEANRTGAALYEVRSTERTEGTLGF